MGPHIKILSSEIITNSGKTHLRDFQGKNLVMITGPAGSGKTSLLQTALYPLGAAYPLRRATKEHLDAVRLEIELGSHTYRLTRNMNTNTHSIEVRQNNTFLIRLDATGANGPTPASWIFEQLGMAKVFADTRVGVDKDPVSMADYLTVSYLTQDESDHQVMRHQTANAKRRVIFETATGLTNDHVEQCKAALREITRKFDAARAEHDRISDFLAEGSLTEATLRSDLAIAVDRLAAVKALLDELRAGAGPESGADDSASPGGDGPQRPPIPASCPTCTADLQHRRRRRRSCGLCLTPDPRRSDSTDSSAPDSGAPDPITEAFVERAQLTEKIKWIRRLLENYDRLKALSDSITRLKGDKERASAALQDAKEIASQNRSLLYELNDEFLQIIRSFKPPWFERRARIDFDNYLPVVEGETYNAMGSGIRVAVNIAYHLALIAVGMRTGGTYIPDILFIDSPRKNLGRNATDRDFANRIISCLLRFQQECADAGHPFQLILVDNDTPAVPTFDSRRISLCHDSPFIPGIQPDAG
ncbi:Hypothetical protein ACTIVE_1814 [Actinomadura verrucosospora]|uniref:Rad50/SbcC-type AAA domain-containing protein n=2 Tax=Actinomadura verrucosospora TaxID=46165 RepID=A0A7D3ZDG8_ACTVE|nr:Hypothetical protein ACTIVE_1814 [Actinomadura verrucosospora]